MTTKFLKLDIANEGCFLAMIEDELGTSVSIPLPIELDNIMVEPIEGTSHHGAKTQDMLAVNEIPSTLKLVWKKLLL